MKSDICVKLDEKIEKLEGTIFNLQQENDKLKTENAQLKKEIETTEQKTKEIDLTAKLALTRSNNLVQHTRNNSIRLFAIADENKHETLDVIMEKSLGLLKSIGMDVSVLDVSIAHRLGTFQPNRLRPIIIKFIAKRHKVQALKYRVS